VLFDPWPLAERVAPTRVLFGPHVTNLGDGRRFSAAHVAYYARRARGGAGVVVTETASVHDSDWPYERAPLAAQCGDSWRAIADAVHAHGSLVVASLGHAGLQGSTTYSQGVLWAPSLVASVMTHEMPYVLEAPDVVALRAGARAGAAAAVAAGCDGVELNAGQWSLFRQFLSGLTNHRDDEWAARGALVDATLAELREVVGAGVLGLRVCADELAPWAGITPELARGLLGQLDGACDYVVIERGSIYSEAATHPDMQAGEAFNESLLAALAGSTREGVTVVAQGSIVEVATAQALLARGLCGAVEMTRAQIADPDLVAKATGRRPGAPRPCVLCNQGCQVRDVRNPIVSCSVNPTAGHELSELHLEEDEGPQPLAGRDVVVAGAGPAGLECARRAAVLGARVRLRESADAVGGALELAAALPGRDRWRTLVAWYEAELARLGVEVTLGDPVEDRSGADVVAVGAAAGVTTLRDGSDGSLPVWRAADVLTRGDREDAPGGAVAVWDPVGHVVGVGLAELLAGRGHAVTLVSPDLVAGTQLSLTGDLVAANARLVGAGVTLAAHATPVAIRAGAVVLEDRFDGAQRELAVQWMLDAGFDLPASGAGGEALIGDALAPRGVYQAILEGRRAAAALAAGRLP
jgi:2,4-dienoyl-CoA reductase (NADPH2)